MASEKSEGGLAGRYANAVFELAQDQKAVDAVSADLASLRRAVDSSPDLARLVRSPMFGAADQSRALKAILEKMGAHPLTINIEANRITRVSSENKALERDFWAYTHTDENSDRVGEFAIGTNIGVERVIGNILQDEKFPGIHIAFGDPYGAHTGAPWKSSTHIDVVGLEFSIWLGDAEGHEEQIMSEGQFLLDA